MLIEHGLKLEKENSGKFSHKQFVAGLKLDGWQLDLIKLEFENGRLNSNSFNHGNPRIESIFRKTTLDNILLDDSEFMVDTQYRFSYIDHQELQHSRQASTEAREFSSQANKLSMWALIIALAALVISFAGAAFEYQSMIYSKQQTQLSIPSNS